MSGAPAPRVDRDAPAAPSLAARVARYARAGAVLAAAYAAMIFWESSRPNPFPFVPPSIFDHDKLLHAGGYAVLGALLRLALVRVRPARRAFVLAVVLAAAYGVTDELHQWFVPGRSADVWDWAADVIGAIAGAAVAAAFLRRRVGAGSIRA